MYSRGAGGLARLIRALGGPTPDSAGADDDDADVARGRPGVPPPTASGVRGLIAGLLILGGALTGTAPIVVVGLLAMVLAVVHEVWARWGLRGVTYERTLGTTRAVWGDDIAVSVSLRNAKRLPLAWVRTETAISPALPVSGREGDPDERPGVLGDTWTAGSHERIRRRHHVLAEHRGVYELGPARIRIGDLFGSPAAETDVQSRQVFLVRPRTVPVREHRPAIRVEGERRARYGLLENPALFAGVREYQVGDPVRRIHWKATARLGHPVSRRFEPARERDVMLAVDILGASRRVTSLGEEDLFEGLCVAASSLARAYGAEGASFGIAAAGFSGSIRPFAYLAPNEAVGQLGRVLDLLARLSSVPSAPFEELLAALARLLRPGTSIVVLSLRNPLPLLPVLRRLGRSGFPIQFVGFGPDAERHAAIARQAGISSKVARLDGPWRTSSQLQLVG